LDKCIDSERGGGSFYADFRKTRGETLLLNTMNYFHMPVVASNLHYLRPLQKTI
jgi:hypothetical protein